jgi:hypothetical protein
MPVVRLSSDGAEPRGAGSLHLLDSPPIAALSEPSKKTRNLIRAPLRQVVQNALNELLPFWPTEYPRNDVTHSPVYFTRGDHLGKGRIARPVNKPASDLADSKPAARRHQRHVGNHVTLIESLAVPDGRTPVQCAAGGESSAVSHQEQEAFREFVQR